MRTWLSLALAVAATAGSVAGCGGSGAVSGSTTTTEGAGAASAGDPTDGGRRRAAEGEPCDYGGAADRTCQIGLYCCYGPPDDPGEHGECRPECPEY